MNNESDTRSIILAVEDVNETRDGIEKLGFASKSHLEGHQEAHKAQMNS